MTLEVEIALVRPADIADGLAEVRHKINDATMVAVILDDAVGERALTKVAEAIVNPSVRVIAAYGKEAPEFHDIVDQVKLRRGQPQLITTLDRQDDLEVFLESIAFTYRGLLEIADQARKMLVCYVSERKSLRSDLERGLNNLRRVTLP